MARVADDAAFALQEGNITFKKSVFCNEAAIFGSCREIGWQHGSLVPNEWTVFYFLCASFREGAQNFRKEVIL